MVDVLPNGMTVTDGSLTLDGAQKANWACTAATNVITCTSSTAIAATNGTSEFSFAVNISPSASGTLTNKAKVGGGGSVISAPTQVTAGACTAADIPAKGCAVDADAAVSSFLTVQKETTTTSITAAGQEVDFTFTVENIESIPMTGVTLTDPHCDTSPVLVSGDDNHDNILQNTETWEYSCTYTVSQSDIDAGNKLSTSATADAAETGPVTGTLDVPVTQDRKIEIEKTASSSTYDTLDQVITYTYKVKNTGNVTLSGQFKVSDDKIDSGTAFDCGNTNALAPGASKTCTAGYTITQADLNAGSLTNTASATNGTVTSPTGSVTLNADQTSAISIEKTASSSTYDAVDQVITYTYKVKNTGNVTLTGQFKVSDDKINSGTAFDCGNTDALAPGASKTCTAGYTITQADLNAGSLTNTASATIGALTSPTGTVTLNADQTSAITIEKTAGSSTYNAVRPGHHLHLQGKEHRQRHPHRSNSRSATTRSIAGRLSTAATPMHSLRAQPKPAPLITPSPRPT